MRTRIFLSFFSLFFGALILLVPNSSSARNCADWEVGVDPVLIFGEGFGEFSSGDQRYQLFNDVTPLPDGESTTLTLFDVSDPLVPVLTWQEIRNSGPIIYEYYRYEGSYQNLILFTRLCDGSVLYLEIFDPEDAANKVSIRNVGLFNSSYRLDNIIWIHDIYAPDNLHSLDLQDWPDLLVSEAIIGSVALPDGVYVRIDPEGAFYVSGGDEVHFLDLDDPANPQEGGFYKLNNNFSAYAFAYAFDQDEEIVYVGDSNELLTVDFSQLSHPRRTGSFACSAEINKIEVYGDEAIVFYANSFQIMSLLDPENITPLSGVVAEPRVGAYKCARSGDLLYLGCGANGVALYDLSDPANPLYLGRGTGNNKILNLVGDYLVGDGKVYLRDCHDVSSVHPQKGPKGVRLGEPFPNPFNPRTSIKFTLDRERAIELRVYDLRGHRMCTLATGSWPTGDYDVVWNGTDDHGRQVPSGVYFFMLQTEEIRQISRAVLVR